MLIMAELNDSNAELLLGFSYLKGDLIEYNINKSMHYLKLSSDENNPEAQYYLGIIYYDGIHVARDINKSIYYLSLSANQNCNEAQCFLGLIYYTSEYITCDIDKSIYYLSLSANQNNAEAQYYLGHLYFYVKHDINKSIFYLSLSANQNDPVAQFLLGMFYSMKEYVKLFSDHSTDVIYISYSILKYFRFFGILIPKDMFHFEIYKKKFYEILELVNNLPYDINKAIYYFTLSSKQNFQLANFYLSFIYCFSSYVVQDIPKSIYYIQKIKNKNAFVLFFQAIYYLLNAQNNKEYTSENIETIIKWIYIFADEEFGLSQYLLGTLLYKFKCSEQDLNKSIYYITKAANNNISRAQYKLAKIFFKGKYVPKNIKQSMIYYHLAAKNGNKNAQYDLGFFYLKGKYVNRDIDNGISLLSSSAENGMKEANFILGSIYHKGKYIKRNINKLIHYYNEGSSFNDPFAKNNLGIIYKNGFGNDISQNIGYAIELFKEAVKLDEEPLSKYNLAHIYLFNENFIGNVDDSIELLIESYLQGFQKSINLLYISLMLKHHQNMEHVINEVENSFGHDYHEIKHEIIQFIRDQKSNKKFIFDEMCELYKKIDFVYDYSLKEIQTDIFLSPKVKPKKQETSNKYYIDSNFYEGFGITF